MAMDNCLQQQGREHTTSATNPQAASPGGAAVVRIEVEDGGLRGWLQVAGAFALYFNHLYASFLNKIQPRRWADLNELTQLEKRPVEQLWYLPELLRDRAPARLLPFGYFVDWIRPGLLLHGRCRHNWSAV
jgi:hypothetical protein